MRILFVSDRIPYPLNDGGNLRTYHILRGLASVHDVTLVAHQPHDVPPPDGWFGERCQVVTVPKPPLLRRLASNGLRFASRGWPLFIVKNWSEPLCRKAVDLFQQQPFDAVHFNHLDTACFVLAHSWPCLNVFDTHNCLSAMAVDLQREHRGHWKGPLFHREARGLQEFERAVCGKMTVSFVCSDQDADAFRQLHPPGHYVVAPNGVDVDYFQPPDPPPAEPGVLVFTGVMSYYANEDAALYFCREVLPLLQDCQPPVRLLLVGRDPPPTVRALHDGKTVIVTGRVDDVRPYLARAQVFVVPLRYGGGTRLKILEAFAMARPVVSTPKGAEGIAAVDGQEIALAADPPAFAQRIRELLLHGAKRETLGAAARQLACARYAWPSIQATVLETYKVLGDTPAATSSNRVGGSCPPSSRE